MLLRKVFGFIILIFVLNGGVVTRTAAAATEMFLSAPGITGNSTNQAHPGEMVINSFSLGFAQRACQGITVKKQLDIASPQLSTAAILGQVFPEMVLSVAIGTSAGSFDSTIIRLANVIVTSLNVASTTTDPTSEVVTLLPQSLEFKQYPQNADGTAGEPISANLSCPKAK